VPISTTARTDTAAKQEKLMKVSARNLIPGTIKQITLGPVNAEVVLEVAPGIEVVSIITRHSVDAMGLNAGDTVRAMIKASNVMIVTD
jgi:molybdopterin-binding protein